MKENKKVVVLGAGSIGCYLGGLLLAGGMEVTFIGRESFRAAIAENGLTLTHFQRDDISFGTVDYQTSNDSLQTADIILLCTKSHDTQACAHLIRQHAGDNVQVISFQNGIRNPETLREILPQASVVAAIVPFNVTSVAAGSFHCGVAGALIAGDNIDQSIIEAFNSVNQAIEIDSNILAAQWTKLIINLNNALNILSGDTLQAGLMQRDYRHALAICVEEAIAVAKANNIQPAKFNGRSLKQFLSVLKLPTWIYKIIMQFTVKIDAKARSSMLDDLEMGRISEVDYLQGEIVRHAENVSMTAPINHHILQLTHDAFRLGKSPKLSGTEIKSALLDSAETVS